MRVYTILLFLSREKEASYFRSFYSAPFYGFLIASFYKKEEAHASSY